MMCVLSSTLQMTIIHGFTCRKTESSWPVPLRQKGAHIWCNHISQGRGNLAAWPGRAKGIGPGGRGMFRGKGGLSMQLAFHSRSGAPGCLGGVDSVAIGNLNPGWGTLSSSGQRAPRTKNRDWASRRIPRGPLMAIGHRASVLFPKADLSLSEDGVWPRC